MKKVLSLSLIAVLFAVFNTGCASTGTPVNLVLAEKNNEQMQSVTTDNEQLIKWLDLSLKGDHSWNAEAGQPIWDAEKGSMHIRNDAAKAVAEEVLANSKKLNGK